jgi:hypothetical protein
VDRRGSEVKEAKEGPEVEDRNRRQDALVERRQDALVEILRFGRDDNVLSKRNTQGLKGRRES